MKIMIKEPQKEVYVKDVEKLDLRDMQKIVDGYIEALTMNHNTVMWLNEEGKLRELDSNIALCSKNKVYDYVVGTVFFTGHHLGETIGLTEEQIIDIYNRFGKFIEITDGLNSEQIQRFSMD